VTEREREEEEARIYSLLAQVKQNLDEMKSISDDMNTIKEQKITSPRVVDQAKTYSLSVERYKTYINVHNIWTRSLFKINFAFNCSLKASLRQCQMDFQYAINSKQRQDLFTLSRSPFDDNSTK